jgi:DNA-binding CsgD family transcriptional regulator
MLRALGDRDYEALVLARLGRAEWDRGNVERAVALCDEARAILDRIAAAASDPATEEWACLARLLGLAEQGGPAVDRPPAVAMTAVAPRPSHGLTPRELEVVRLVAAGRSNREVADALSISVDTVKRHLTNVLGKLDLPSRSALTAYAHTHGLA